jgi:hypothetical protein
LAANEFCRSSVVVRQQIVRDRDTMAQQADAKDKLYFNVLEKEVTLKDLDNKVRASLDLAQFANIIHPILD